MVGSDPSDKSDGSDSSELSEGGRERTHLGCVPTSGEGGRERRGERQNDREWRGIEDGETYERGLNKFLVKFFDEIFANCKTRY